MSNAEHIEKLRHITAMLDTYYDDDESFFDNVACIDAAIAALEREDAATEEWCVTWIRDTDCPRYYVGTDEQCKAKEAELNDPVSESKFLNKATAVKRKRRIVGPWKDVK